MQVQSVDYKPYISGNLRSNLTFTFTMTFFLLIRECSSKLFCPLNQVVWFYLHTWIKHTNIVIRYWEHFLIWFLNIGLIHGFQTTVSTGKVCGLQVCLWLLDLPTPVSGVPSQYVYHLTLSRTVKRVKHLPLENSFLQHLVFYNFYKNYLPEAVSDLKG